jgi:hypothetical protein
VETIKRKRNEGEPPTGLSPWDMEACKSSCIDRQQVVLLSGMGSRRALFHEARATGREASLKSDGFRVVVAHRLSLANCIGTRHHAIPLFLRIECSNGSESIYAIITFQFFDLDPNCFAVRPLT